MTKERCACGVMVDKDYELIAMLAQSDAHQEFIETIGKLGEKYMSEEVKPEVQDVVVEKKEERTYKLDVLCDNCDMEGTVIIPFGKVFTDASSTDFSSGMCEHCGCYRLQKQSKKDSPYAPVRFDLPKYR